MLFHACPAPDRSSAGGAFGALRRGANSAARGERKCSRNMTTPPRNGSRIPATRRHPVKHRPPARLDDEALIELVQRQTFGFFWEGAHPSCGLARDRTGLAIDPDDDLVCTGGSGFAIMAIIVAAERGWIGRGEALDRLGLMLDFLERGPCFHGLFPHYMNGRTGAVIRFGRKDDGSDIVESSFLFQGLLCARQYFSADTAAEKNLL